MGRKMGQVTKINHCKDHGIGRRMKWESVTHSLVATMAAAIEKKMGSKPVGKNGARIPQAKATA
jgi:hypothetical protein